MIRRMGDDLASIHGEAMGFFPLEEVCRMSQWVFSKGKKVWFGVLCGF
jgi:hypothetical protein